MVCISICQKLSSILLPFKCTPIQGTISKFILKFIEARISECNIGKLTLYHIKKGDSGKLLIYCPLSISKLPESPLYIYYISDICQLVFGSRHCLISKNNNKAKLCLMVMANPLDLGHGQKKKISEKVKSLNVDVRI